MAWRLFVLAAALSGTGALHAALEPTGDGFGSIRFAPNGNIGLLLTENPSRNPNSRADNRLVYQERSPRGKLVTSEVIFDYGFTNASIEAALFYDAAANPTVYELTADGIARYVRTSGDWALESVTPTPGFLQHMVATAGLDGSIHFAFQDISQPNKVSITYARRDPAGNWTWEVAAKNLREFPQRIAFETPDPDLTINPRNLSIAVDRRGRAHIVFCADGLNKPVGGGTQVRTELFYATNARGRWKTSTAFSPNPGFGDGGMGASIAAAPNGTIAVAVSFLPRGNAGSPGRARLLYLRKAGGKRWSESTVADTSNNYVARDGEKGTGLNPMLTFTERSQPVIVFNDHASTHFDRVGAFSFSGQVRLATRKSAKSGRWKTKTLIRKKGEARDSQIYEPVVAASGRSFAAAANTYQFSGGKYQTTFTFKAGKLSR